MDIPFGQGALIDLGESVSNLGEALAGIGTHVKAYQDAAAAAEFLQARTSLDSDIANHLDQSATDPNFKELDKNWQQALPNYMDKALSVLTLQKSKKMFDMYAGGALKQAENKIYAQKRAGLANFARNSLQNALDTDVRLADPVKAEQDVTTALDGGIITGAQAETYRKTHVEMARINSVKNMISDLSFPEQIGMLNDPKQVAQLGITGESVTNLKTWATQQYEANKKINSDKLYDASRTMTDDLVKRQNNGDTIPIQELRQGVVATDGTTFSSYWKDALNAEEKKIETTQKELATRTASVYYQKPSSSMAMWRTNTGSSVPPWTPETIVFRENNNPNGKILAIGLTQAVANKVIDESESTKLTSAYDSAVAYKKEDKNQKDYTKINELYGIALDDTKTPETRAKLIDEKLYGQRYLGNGVPGSEADAIKDSSKAISAALKAALTSLNDLYYPQRQYNAGNAEKLKSLALDEADTKRQLAILDAQHPNDPAGLSELLHGLNVKNFSGKLNEAVTKTPAGETARVGPQGVWNGFWNVQYSEPIKLSVQAQESPESFDVGPGALQLRSEFEKNREKIVSDTTPLLPKEAKGAIPQWRDRLLYFQKGTDWYRVRVVLDNGTKSMQASKFVNNNWIPVK
jgi:hypothetical protein